ncbi:MAG: PatB family C-S lyase [Negativicutes bacterium]|nr:PatB family C-S lyase [Negativicutes bacterium]
MDRHQFGQMIERRNTGAEKWDALGEVFGDKDLLPLWVADMDFAAPPAVAEAIASRAAHPIYGYHRRGDGYYEAATAWLENRHGWKVAENWLVDTPGVVTALSVAIQAFTRPGDKVLIQAPVYPRFFSCVTKNKRQLVINPLARGGNGYGIDFDHLEQELAAGVRLILLCSPHNPVGRVWTEQELMRLGETCLRFGALIVADEIHADIVFKGHRHLPLASLSPELAASTVTCIAPSKTFNIAGLAASLTVIADPGLRTRFNDITKALNICDGNIFGNIALEAAYRHGGPWLDSLLGYLEDNADFLVRFFARNIPGIKVEKPQGTYLAWLDCRALGIDPAELNAYFVRQAKVGLSDGARFGREGQGFMRLNFGCPRPLLQDGLERIAAAYSRLPPVF